MRSIMLAVSFLKKQWVMNVVLVVEILISVIMLSELFLFVSDRMDNQRAAKNCRTIICMYFQNLSTMRRRKNA